MIKVNKCFTIIFMLVATFILFITDVGETKEIEIIGNTAADATVFTKTGEDMTGNPTNRWEHYDVSYSWKIPAKISIESGDIAQFTLPSNIQIMNDTSGEVKNANGDVIGTLFVPKGSKTITLTFNDYYQKHSETNIHGTLTVVGNGVEETEHQTWNINKYGYLDSNNKPSWSIVYNPESNSLTDVKLVDTMGKDHILDSDSVVIQYGTVDMNNNFIPSSIESNPSQFLTQTSTGFEVKFSKLDSAVRILYQTIPVGRVVDLSNTVSGVADYVDAESVTTTIQVDGNGTADGDVIPGITSTVSTISSVVTSTNNNSSGEYSNTIETTGTETTTSEIVSTATDAVSSTNKDSSNEYSNTTGTTELETSVNGETEGTQHSILSSEHVRVEDTGTKERFVSTGVVKVDTNHSSMVSKNSENGVGTNKNENGGLPQTGNDKKTSILLSFIGLMTIIAVIGYIIYRKKNKK